MIECFATCLQSPGVLLRQSRCLEGSGQQEAVHQVIGRPHLSSRFWSCFFDVYEEGENTIRVLKKDHNNNQPWSVIQYLESYPARCNVSPSVNLLSKETGSVNTMTGIETLPKPSTPLPRRTGHSIKGPSCYFVSPGHDYWSVSSEVHWMAGESGVR